MPTSQVVRHPLDMASTNEHIVQRAIEFADVHGGAAAAAAVSRERCARLVSAWEEGGAGATSARRAADEGSSAVADSAQRSGGAGTSRGGAGADGGAGGGADGVASGGIASDGIASDGSAMAELTHCAVSATELSGMSGCTGPHDACLREHGKESGAFKWRCMEVSVSERRCGGGGGLSARGLRWGVSSRGRWRKLKFSCTPRRRKVGAPLFRHLMSPADDPSTLLPYLSRASSDLIRRCLVRRRCSLLPTPPHTHAR